MNKTELASVISEYTDGKISVEIVNEILDTFINVIGDRLIEGDKVKLAKFGVFTVFRTKERNYLIPRTKEKIKIPSKKVVKFKASPKINSKVN